MSFTKGILLAGGAGSRLDPITRVVSKQLLPVFDKPMVYYPLSTLMLAGIREVLVISTPHDVGSFERLLGTGESLGLSIRYAVQAEPRGLADAFRVGRSFVGNDAVSMILGDNIFYGQGLQAKLAKATARDHGATVYSYAVKDPQRYGVVVLDDEQRPVSIEEKPQHPRSRQAVTGLYFYDNQVVEMAADLQPSSRGELEITDINRLYMQQGELHVVPFGRGFAWLDTGTETSLLQAANFVETVQARQGLRIACVEEVAYRMGYIDAEQLARLAAAFNNPYGQYLREVIDLDGGVEQTRRSASTPSGSSGGEAASP